MLDTPDARGRLVPLLSFFSLRTPPDMPDLDALPAADPRLPPDDLPLPSHVPQRQSGCCTSRVRVSLWQQQRLALTIKRSCAFWKLQHTEDPFS